ncbi:MAG TPA: ExeM/NucH family extracellular endonuclease, partial [Steroidobacteraceae bacterium]|nr:ExeM/NucH family extracellular endonuclease [Steroidobacteraceae bacterium]
PTHTVSAVQGSAATQLGGGAHDDRSPLEGSRVTLQGVVVADFQSIPQSTRSGELRGFFLEEESEDHDADPSTAEGLFVFTGSVPPLDVQEGQTVCVTGFVSEFFGMTQVTAANAGSLELVNDHVPLPAPSVLQLPVVGDINDYYEQFEGMRVSFASPLYVAEYFEVARYGQIVLNANARPFQYTHLDTTPTSAEYSQHLEGLARGRIILDDDNNTQNAPLPNGAFFHPQPNGLAVGVQGTDFFRGGDRIDALVGVLHWSFAGQSGTDAWRVRPTRSNPIEFEVRNPRPARAPSRFGQLRVATFNVLNYFNSIDTTASTNVGTCGPSLTLDCRGADSAEEFDRQNAKLTQALRKLDADVLGLVEIENNGSSGASSAIAELTERLNNAIGSPAYSYINTGTIGTDAITVGILYKTASAKPVGVTAVLDDAQFVDPNGTGLQRNRPALAQTFEMTGRHGSERAFTLVVNHLKSKGADGASGLDADQLDGQSAWNDTRTKAASYLVNQWLPTNPTGKGDADVLIVGDLNAYRGETPVTTLRAAGYRDLHQDIEGLKAYSYVFDGQLGYLDHALASPSMNLQVACLSSWPINADEVPVFDYNDSVRDVGESTFEAEPSANNLYEPTPARTSDHDPVVVDMNLCPKHGPTAKICVAANVITRLACVTSKRR